MINIKRLSDSAKIPTYATAGAACFDLYAADSVGIRAGAAGTVKTDLSFAVPDGHVMLVFSRSGHGFKSGVRLSNCTGVIDSDYRGEVMVRLQNDGINPFTVLLGDRVAQAMVLPVEQVVFNEVDDLDETERGVNGFGSTGA
jgi:dUTP pyrophosphatase